MRSNTRLFLMAGLLIALALALVASPFASSSPDGLEAVAAQEGFAEAGQDSAVETPLAGYEVNGIEETKLSTGLSGAVGVLMTFGLGIGLFAALKSFAPPSAKAPSSEA